MSALPPRSEDELILRAGALAGLSLAGLAERLGAPVPTDPRRAKGWPGQLLERALGATAASAPEPDFQLIGVELKSIPVGHDGAPLESTYVCVVPLDGEGSPHWRESNVYRKLARVLWVPILAPRDLGVGERRIGTSLLWSPSEAEETALRQDWEELMDRVVLGRIDEITARDGTCLQIRPKAASSRSRRRAVGVSGEPAERMPRGFYLRASFTRRVLERHFQLPG